MKESRKPNTHNKYIIYNNNIAFFSFFNRVTVVNFMFNKTIKLYCIYDEPKTTQTFKATKNIYMYIYFSNAYFN